MEKPQTPYVKIIGFNHTYLYPKLILTEIQGVKVKKLFLFFVNNFGKN